MTTSGGTRISSSAWSRFSRTGRVTRRTAEGVAALLYPPECITCGRSLDAFGVLCGACAEVLPSIEGDRCVVCGAPLEDPSLDLCLPCGTRERGFDSLHALGPYDEGWGGLVRALKFDRERAVGRWLGRRLADAVLEARIRVGSVTFVPMTADERHARGFNQARVLAGVVAARLGLPMRGVLRKVRRTAPQAGLSAARRRENLRGAFRALPSRGERVLLIDDICTTGSTAEACSKALLRAGSRSVDVMVVARA